MYDVNMALASKSSKYWSNELLSTRGMVFPSVVNRDLQCDSLKGKVCISVVWGEHRTRNCLSEGKVIIDVSLTCSAFHGFYKKL